MRLRNLFKRSLIVLSTAVVFGVFMPAATAVAQSALQLRWEQKGLYVSPYDFVAGDWKIEGAEDALQLATLTGRHHKKPKGLTPATVEITVEKEGTYALWVNSLDYEKNQPGSRYFQVAYNDELIDKRFGTHGQDGFRWELAGKVHLKKGANRLQLIDASAFYARCDGLFLTKDLDMSAEEIVAASRKSGSINFKPEPLEKPDRLAPDAKTSNTITLANDRVKIVFYQLVAGKKRQVESEVFVAGTRVKPRSESDALVL